MFGRKKPTPERADKRLGKALQKISADSDILAIRIVQNKPMPKGDAIQVTETETLFRNTGADGNFEYDFHHYTDNLKTMDAQAQIHLMVFFGNIVKLNALVAPFERRKLSDEVKAIVSELLDRIRVQAWFSLRFLARANITTTLLDGATINTAIDRELAELSAEDKSTMNQLGQNLFTPQKFASYLPMEQIPLCVTFGRRSESDEKFINGVWFPKAEGEKILEQFAKMQAQTVAQHRVV